ncbi:MAG: hypothetical protein ACU85V_04135, partial [Gammaproteobacteria bacterium]
MKTRTETWFRFVCANPVGVLLVNLAVVAGLGAALPQLYKDTSPDAYIEPDNPALIYRNSVKENFSLDDSFVIAIEAPPGQTIYNPGSLGLVAAITDMMESVDNIDPERVISLVTEKIIVGGADSLDISPAFEDPPTTPAQIESIRRR